MGISYSLKFQLLVQNPTFIGRVIHELECECEPQRRSLNLVSFPESLINEKHPSFLRLFPDAA